MNKGIQMKIFMTIVTAIFVASLFTTVAGCSGGARKDYYEAVSVSSVAQSNTQIARFEALKHLSETGDGEGVAAVAAVMAIAMMREDTVRPQYVESEALSYTKALAAPIAGIGALWIQSDLSRDLNDSNNKTQQAQINANSKEQTALFDAFGKSGSGSDIAVQGIIDVTQGALGTVETIVTGNNSLINDLSDTLQPIVPVEIVPVEIVPVEIVPIANPNVIAPLTGEPGESDFDLGFSLL